MKLKNFQKLDHSNIYYLLTQGGTIKWFVNLLKIDKKKDGQKSISHEVNDTVVEHIMEGIDFISGKYGNHYLYVRIRFILYFYFSKSYHEIF